MLFKCRCNRVTGAVFTERYSFLMKGSMSRAQS